MNTSEFYKIGYVGISLTLSEKEKLKYRTITKTQYLKSGRTHTGDILLDNLITLFKILKFNVSHNILHYRASSSLWPLADMQSDITELPNFKEISIICKQLGSFIKEHNIRLSFHPGHFTALVNKNNNDHLLQNSIKDLLWHGKLLDEMGLTPSRWNKLNIHVGPFLGKSKEYYRDEFAKNFLNMPICVRDRLVLENDDSLNGYSAKELYDLFFTQLQIPVTFDNFHHNIGNKSGLTEYEAAQLCKTSWDYYNVPPVMHFSDSRRIYEDSKAKQIAHSDYIHTNDFMWYLENGFWVMTEVKRKDIAVLQKKLQLLS